MQYSPSTGCFYPDDIAYPEGVIPEDAVAVSRDAFHARCTAVPGSTISVDGTDLVIAPPAPPTLAQIKATKVGELNSVYQAAATAPLNFNTAGGASIHVTRDAAHKAMVDTAIAAGAKAWTANVWIDDANAAVMPFTFADLGRLQAALAAPTTPSLMDLMAKVSAVHAASDPDAVAAITF